MHFSAYGGIKKLQNVHKCVYAFLPLNGRYLLGFKYINQTDSEKNNFDRCSENWLRWTLGYFCVQRDHFFAIIEVNRFF